MCRYSLYSRAVSAWGENVQEQNGESWDCLRRPGEWGRVPLDNRAGGRSVALKTITGWSFCVA